MEDYKNKLLALIDSSTSKAQSLTSSFNEMLNEFGKQFEVFENEFDVFNLKMDEFALRNSTLFNDFDDLMKQVKEGLKDFSVTVPFDGSIGEEINYGVKDGKLEIEVTYHDETSEKSNKTTVLIPKNCDVEKISLTTDDEKKTATIVIPKIVKCEKKNEEPLKEEEKETAPSKPNRFWFKRDNKGRFVRRVPKKD